MRTILLGASLLPAACSYSLEADRLEIRAEITRLEESLPPEAPIWISEGPNRFDLVIEDHSERVPDYIYRHILAKLRDLKPEEPEVAGDFDRDACEADPSRLRGRFWRVRGLVGDLRAEALAGPDSPVPRVYAAALFDARSRPVLVHVLQKPPVLTLGEDHVETRALFVKILEYTTRSGRRVSAPFFIGRTLRRFL